MTVPAAAVPASPLHQREVDVLDCAEQGLTIGETGKLLYLSADTVKHWRKAVVRRYAARNMTHALVLHLRAVGRLDVSADS